MYLSSNTPSSSGTTTTVKFDETRTEDFSGGLDTSTGVYTVREAGDYHVDFLIDWSGDFSSGDRIDYGLRINGGVTGGLAADTTVGANSADIARCFSKTVFGLKSDDTLKVSV
ncbi:MAG: hypothetical protein V5A18_04265 [Haloarculaceae archaeon]